MEYKNIGIMPNRVAMLRKEHNLSQTELGEKLNVSRRTICNIEKGLCTLSNLISLADLFDVSTDYIVMWSNCRRSQSVILAEIDLQILAHLRDMTQAEKERLLKHLRLENALKFSNSK